LYAPFALLKIGLYTTYFWRAWVAVQKILSLLISDYVWLTPSLKPSPYYKFFGQQLHALKILIFQTSEKTWKIHGLRAQVLNIMRAKMGNDIPKTHRMRGAKCTTAHGQFSGTTEEAQAGGK
jgi:hypothetical protein